MFAFDPNAVFDSPPRNLQEWLCVGVISASLSFYLLSGTYASLLCQLLTTAPAVYLTGQIIKKSRKNVHLSKLVLCFWPAKAMFLCVDSLLKEVEGFYMIQAMATGSLLFYTYRVHLQVLRDPKKQTTSSEKTAFKPRLPSIREVEDDKDTWDTSISTSDKRTVLDSAKIFSENDFMNPLSNDSDLTLKEYFSMDKSMGEFSSLSSIGIMSASGDLPEERYERREQKKSHKLHEVMIGYEEKSAATTVNLSSASKNLHFLHLFNKLSTPVMFALKAIPGVPIDASPAYGVLNPFNSCKVQISSQSTVPFSCRLGLDAVVSPSGTKSFDRNYFINGDKIHCPIFVNYD